MDSPKTQEALYEALRLQTPQSGKLWKDSQDVIPGGLLSGARKFKPYPFFTDRGQGAFIWDVDGNRYIDCCIAYGVLFLGHRPSFVIEAIDKQLKQGLVYGTPHELEIQFAESLIECIPCAERILVCNSGTEATMQAIRVMRAYTGKTRVAKFEGAYHGWHDYASWSVFLHQDEMGSADRPTPTPESAGIPDEIKDTILMLPFNDHAFKMIEEYASELAGVMIEPVFGGGTIPVGKEFLQKLREVTQRVGVPLLFDEVITGFRMGLGGAQEYYDIKPDLATYGKIIGGGLPIGAVAVTQEMMKTVLSGDLGLTIAGTFSGNPLTLAAGNAVLTYLKENRNMYKELEKKGNRLRDGFNEYARQKGWPASMTGVASMFQIHLSEKPIVNPRDMLNRLETPMADLQLYLRLNGVFIPWIHLAFISAAHGEADVEEVLRVHKLSVEACLSAYDLI